MARELNVRSDEAFETAGRLAERHKLTTTEVVVRALRCLEATQAGAVRYEDLSPQQKPLHDRLAELGRKAREALWDAAPPADADLTPAQQAEYEALRRIAGSAAQSAKAGATSDHSDMYDEHGLPI